MPGVDSMDLVRRMHARRPDVPVVMLAGDPSVHAAVAAMRQGVFGYVTKPFDDEALAAIVERALEMGCLKRENRRLRKQLEAASSAAGFVAESTQSKQLVAMIRRVAPARSTALIEGESGTGKELVARMLHYWSNRAEGPFVAVNCKAFADGVVESELFGHEKAPLPGQSRRVPDASNAPRAARCFSTKSPKRAPTSKPNSCACSRTAKCCGVWNQFYVLKYTKSTYRLNS